MLRGKTLLRAAGAILGPTLFVAHACAWPASSLQADLGPTIEVVGLKLRYGTEPVTIEDLCRKSLSDTTFAILRREGMRGVLECAGSGQFQTRVRHGKIIVIMTHQVTEPVELPLPVDEIVYRQFEDAWLPYPADAKTTNERLRLYPAAENPTWATEYWVPTRHGGRTGGTLVTWGRAAPAT